MISLIPKKFTSNYDTSYTCMYVPVGRRGCEMNGYYRNREECERTRNWNRQVSMYVLLLLLLLQVPGVVGAARTPDGWVLSRRDGP